MLAYGHTQNLAYQVFFAAYTTLKNITTVQVGDTLIYNYQLASGPTQSRDATLQWPYQLSTFLVKSTDYGDP